VPSGASASLSPRTARAGARSLPGVYVGHDNLRMTKRQTKAGPAPRGTRKARTLELITGTDALAILEILAARSQNLAQEIDAIAKELFSDVEVDEMAASVQAELESLHVEDVWDRSGPMQSGYVDPGEAAWEMFEEALRPFQEEVDKYKQLSMQREADLAYQGILRGIYEFHEESSTEYKKWAEDAPREYFERVLGAWKALFGVRLPISRMVEFLQTDCSNWAEWATKYLRARKP